MSSVLRQAWALRAPSFSPSGALRLFYGPGEVSPGHPLAAWAVDGYGAYLWVTEWEGPHAPLSLEELSQITRDFYEPLGFVGAIVLTRPRQGVPDQPRVLWGQTPPKAFGVYERWGEVALEYEIRLLESRHPGLFLDHEPLRRWLACSGQMQGRSVLNTFAYTGSLSVAAWRGGARSVTTVDLSRPTLDWAKRNAEINGGMACGGLTESSATPESQSRFFVGDFFEQIPRLARRGERFDVVIADPPSFSRAKKKTFSTQKDLRELHSHLFSVLESPGLLISSINSANVSAERFESEILQAAQACGRSLKKLRRIEQPPSFPSHPENPKSRYLKGFVFEAR